MVLAYLQQGGQFFGEMGLFCRQPTRTCLGHPRPVRGWRR